MRDESPITAAGKTIALAVAALTFILLASAADEAERAEADQQLSAAVAQAQAEAAERARLALQASVGDAYRAGLAAGVEHARGDCQVAQQDDKAAQP